MKSSCINMTVSRRNTGLLSVLALHSCSLAGQKFTSSTCKYSGYLHYRSPLLSGVVLLRLLRESVKVFNNLPVIRVDSPSFCLFSLVSVFFFFIPIFLFFLSSFSHSHCLSHFPSLPPQSSSSLYSDFSLIFSA